jgi:hypothetical protein
MAEIPSLLATYQRLFKARPLFWSGVVVTYAAIIFTTFAYLEARKTEQSQQRLMLLEEQLEELRHQRNEQGVTNSHRERPGFMRDLSFNENWVNDDTKTNVARLLDYAAFAIQKADFRRAERLYAEAETAQTTFVVPYNLARLHYLEGDLKGTAIYLENVIALDTGARYPELRLYLGVVQYELGQTAESRKSLQLFIDRTLADKKAD